MNPAIIIDDYYISGNHQSLLGVAEDGQLYTYMATDAVGDGYALADEGLTSVALGGSSLGDSSYLFESVEYGDGLMSLCPWFLGAATIGGIGYAINNNKDDDNDNSSSSLQPTTQSEPQPVSDAASQSEAQPVPEVASPSEFQTETVSTPGGGSDVTYNTIAPT
ncbi:hypothetical protein LPW36_16970 [Jinshanibacter sp. LJY008]|uniref:Uncharacterized protein n=1 Tax=Limnobaculum eriocheiris TaxID=2897391 RepID=A0A9X1N0P3_9GAMM|nr:hypothetical protein [Limnobaculum eriocheiris]MCD1127650.1 hypothetical protein [Limnobaculum eriocheiris]